MGEIELPEVLRESVTVVSGVAPSLDLLPGSVATVLTREELEQRAPQRLYQALESIAGASKLGDGADSVPALRNLGRGRTLILIDGARVTTERRAGPSATFVDPASLGSVEVVRGPGSVIYGSDAFGGVLNVVTRDPEMDGFHLSYGAEGAFESSDERSGFVAASTPVGSGAAARRGALPGCRQLLRPAAARRSTTPATPRSEGRCAMSFPPAPGGCASGRARPRRATSARRRSTRSRSGPTIRTRTRIA